MYDCSPPDFDRALITLARSWESSYDQFVERVCHRDDAEHQLVVKWIEQHTPAHLLDDVMKLAARSAWICAGRLDPDPSARQQAKEFASAIRAVDDMTQFLCDNRPTVMERLELRSTIDDALAVMRYWADTVDTPEPDQQPLLRRSVESGQWYGLTIRTTAVDPTHFSAFLNGLLMRLRDGNCALNDGDLVQYLCAARTWLLDPTSLWLAQSGSEHGKEGREWFNRFREVTRS